jgi:hypothetical protein
MTCAMMSYDMVVRQREGKSQSQSLIACLTDAASAKAMLPFLEERLRGARELLGEDHWSYGLAALQADSFIPSKPCKMK